MSYIKSVSGLPTFAMLSAVSIVDPELSYPHRLVLSILALHANSKTGASEPGQNRIAAMAGWFKKDKVTGELMPNDAYVSSLINNVNHTKKSDRCGPGLVQLGYVKPGHKQKGFNQTNTYFLTNPEYIDGDIVRPDGGRAKARIVPSLVENSGEYKRRKSKEHDAYESQEAAPKAQPTSTRVKFTEADQLPLEMFVDSDKFFCMGDEYTRKDCELDLINYRDGFGRIVPNSVYSHFKVALPPHFEGDY